MALLPQGRYSRIVRGRVLLVCLLGGSSLLAACASILGIDDGIPREDAGVVDVAQEVAPIVDSAPPDAGRDADASADVAVDVPLPFSALGCGSATCNAVTQACCRTGAGGDAGYVYKCISDAGACTGNLPVVVNCDRTDNCAAQGKPGQICCANALNNPATNVACTSPSFCPTNTLTILCGPGDDELCMSNGLACLPSTYTIIGWKICK